MIEIYIAQSGKYFLILLQKEFENFIFIKKLE